MMAARLGLLIAVACHVAKFSPGQASHLYGEDMDDTFGFSRSQETPQMELETPQMELEMQNDESLDHPASKGWGSRLDLPRSLRTSATQVPVTLGPPSWLRSLNQQQPGAKRTLPRYLLHSLV